VSDLFSVVFVDLFFPGGLGLIPASPDDAANFRWHPVGWSARISLARVNTGLMD
jgi:hypothetical protein